MRPTAIRARSFWLAVPCALLVLTGCGDGAVEPLASLPATFYGELHQFGASDSTLICFGDASFTVLEDGSGTLEYGPYGIPTDYWRTCTSWWTRPRAGAEPLPGSFTGSWVAPDTLEFHIELHCPAGDCSGRFHATDSDVWRAYVSSDIMQFVGKGPYQSYRFEFVGMRQ